MKMIEYYDSDKLTEDYPEAEDLFEVEVDE